MQPNSIRSLSIATPKTCSPTTLCTAIRRCLLGAGLLAGVEASAQVLELSTLDGANGFAINGVSADDDSGFFVSGIGDMNGDGIDDIAIGTYTADLNGTTVAGQSYVVFGDNSHFSAELELSSLDGSNGFTVNGIDTGAQDGSTLSAAGDVNNDGLADLIIGVYFADANGITAAGQGYVIFGRSDGFTESIDLTALNGSDGFVINGILASDFTGVGVGAAGDINNDGVDDILIGANFANPNNVVNAGTTYVVFGNSNGFNAAFDLSTLDGNNGFAIGGIDQSDRSGRNIAGIGDINGDGVDDLITTSTYANGFTGESYVVYGNSNGFPAFLGLSELDGNNGFIINGINVSDISGSRVSAAGDINNDGMDDLAISAAAADPNSVENAGQVYVLLGRSDNFPASFDLSTLDGSNGFMINGVNEFDNINATDGVGDFNRDGISDIIIGAQIADPNGIDAAGISYIVYGRSTPFAAVVELSDLNSNSGLIINGINAGDNSGFAVSAAGDINDDGSDDVLIGALNADPNGRTDAGQSYVVFGDSLEEVFFTDGFEADSR